LGLLAEREELLHCVHVEERIRQRRRRRVLARCVVRRKQMFVVGAWNQFVLVHLHKCECLHVRWICVVVEVGRLPVGPLVEAGKVLTTNGIFNGSNLISGLRHIAVRPLPVLRTHSILVVRERWERGVKLVLVRHKQTSPYVRHLLDLSLAEAKLRPEFCPERHFLLPRNHIGLRNTWLQCCPSVVVGGVVQSVLGVGEHGVKLLLARWLSAADSEKGLVHTLRRREIVGAHLREHVEVQRIVAERAVHHLIEQHLVGLPHRCLAVSLARNHAA